MHQIAFSSLIVERLVGIKRIEVGVMRAQQCDKWLLFRASERRQDSRKTNSDKHFQRIQPMEEKRSGCISNEIQVKQAMLKSEAACKDCKFVDSFNPFASLIVVFS